MIFWKHIKGLHKSTSSDELWSFIRFQKKAGSSQAESTKFANVPSIHLNTSDDDTTSSPSCGHIITEKATGQSITNPFHFLSNLEVDGTLDVDGATTLNSTLDVDDRCTFHAGILLKTSSWYVYARDNLDDDYCMFKAAFGGNYHLQVGDEDLSVWMPQSLQIGGSGFSTSHIAAGDLSATNAYLSTSTCTSYSQAQYFNATSDRRAKTNIQPLLIDALELVKKIQLYSFKYKETDTPSIGIIAQDVQDVNINGFKLVDNEEATGKDLDYMTIHESKLTYILWKAVQEQQKEIEELRKQLNELKKN